MAWKIALAGIGKIARDQHVPSISASADFELAATVTRHEGVDDIENYTDIDAMLERILSAACRPPGWNIAPCSEEIRAGQPSRGGQGLATGAGP